MTIDYTKAKILIVDDNPANIDILLELLSSFDVRAALDGKSALKAIAQEKPDLILLDIMMPDISGFEVCARLKHEPRTKDIPIIFLSANAQAQSIVQGFELGGVDYIKKPYLSQEVIARVQTHLKLQMSMRYLEHIANVDELTGISNRRRFFKHSEELFTTAKNDALILHVFVFDLDNFKSINDTYGHAAGDLVLKRFTELLKKHIPKISCFARFGGDEFVLMLRDITKEQALSDVETLRQAVENASFSRYQALKVTISAGMATLQRSDHDIDTLIGRADEMLYKAKEQRNAIRA